MDENTTSGTTSSTTSDNEPVVLDARNLLCPMPVIRVQEAVESLQHETIIKVVCTDPGVLHDIPAWVRVHGHTLISAEEKNDEYIVIVKVNKQ